MTAYKNFTVDLPERIATLDALVRPLAILSDLEVSYLVMKLASAFLLPYERVAGASGARRSEVIEPQRIRRVLELDKRFHESSYCNDLREWSFLEVEDFHRGPRDWNARERQPDDQVVHAALKTVRHSIAHSNLFFGGEQRLEHIFIGSRKHADREAGPYLVLRGTIAATEYLVDAWIANLKALRASPSLIWRQLDDAA